MKLDRIALLPFFLFPACAVHVYVHEVSPDASRAESMGGSMPSSPDAISGVVRDAQGRPVRAHVVLVFQEDGGSYGTGTSEDGTFVFQEIPPVECVLVAGTEDGRVAIERRVLPAHGPFELRLQPGSTMTLAMDGRPSARCAVWHGDVRVEDFTIRAGEPNSVVVPSGGIRIQIYDGDETLAESTVDLAAGERNDLRFELD